MYISHTIICFFAYKNFRQALECHMKIVYTVAVYIVKTKFLQIKIHSTKKHAWWYWCTWWTCWIPGGQYDPPIIWVILDGVNDLSQLVYALPRVVGVHVLVRCSKMAPLKPVHWAQITCMSGGEGRFEPFKTPGHFN